MQEQKKSSSPSVPSTPASSSSRSSGPAPPDCEPEPAAGTSTGSGRRLPANAFADPFLEKLRLVVQLLEDEAESPTEAEAALAGPLTVERVVTRGGSAAWAVVKRSEPIARGGRAAAVCGSRGEALRLAAVLPAAPKLNPYHLSDAPKRLGWPLHVNRRHVGHVSRLSKVEDAKAAGKKAWSRRQVLLTHLHVARYLAASPEALAQVAESMGPEALAALGRGSRPAPPVQWSSYEIVIDQEAVWKPSPSPRSSRSSSPSRSARRSSYARGRRSRRSGTATGSS